MAFGPDITPEDDTYGGNKGGTPGQQAPAGPGPGPGGGFGGFGGWMPSLATYAPLNTPYSPMLRQFGLGGGFGGPSGARMMAPAGAMTPFGRQGRGYASPTYGGMPYLGPASYMGSPGSPYGSPGSPYFGGPAYQPPQGGGPQPGSQGNPYPWYGLQDQPGIIGGDYGMPFGSERGRDQMMAILQNAWGGGLLDPRGSPLLMSQMNEAATRNAQALQQRAATQGNLMGLDPAQRASYNLQSSLGTQGDVANILANARLGSMQRNQDLLQQLASEYIGGEGIQRVGKYDYGRLTGGGGGAGQWLGSLGQIGGGALGGWLGPGGWWGQRPGGG